MPKPIITIDKSQLFRIIKSNLNENTRKQTQEEDIDFEKLFNFSSIPEQELEEQYVDLSFTVSSSGYGGKFMGVNGRILKEDATSTLPTNETKKQMQTKFNLKDWQFATQTLANNVRLVVLYPGIFRNTRLIEKAMSACGWSLAKKGHIVKNRMVWKAMSFDPMFQKDVSYEARDYKYLYHWTPLYNLESIRENGLLPKSENKLFDYPDRIHLIKGGTLKQDIYDIGRQLCMANKRIKNRGNYVLLSIDLSKVPMDTEIYYDPRFEFGYYTKVPIPSNSITPVNGYNFKTNQEFKI